MNDRDTAGYLIPHLRIVRAALLAAVAAACLLAAGCAIAQGGSSRTTSTLRTLDEVTIPVRDVVQLAERLGGLRDIDRVTIPPAPEYHIGDRETFFVGHGDGDLILEVEAVLAAAAPGVYLWVQDGVPYDAALLSRTARLLDERLFPAVRELFGPEVARGIDGDAHISVLHVTGIGEDIGGYFNDTSAYPRQIFSASNERKMFVIAADNTPFNSPAYLYVLAHEFVHMIQHNQDENEETWVAEGTAELGAFLTTTPRAAAIALYLNNPTIQLNTWDIDTPMPYYGAASLFFVYLVERFGPEFVLAHSQEPADGITGIENALAAVDARDPLTGGPLTFTDIFADWLVANLIDAPELSDGRFGYGHLALGQIRATPLMAASTYPLALQGQQANQFGANYIRLEASAPQMLVVTFAGSDRVSVIPTAPHSGTHLYWANRSDQSAPRLTRAFDLSGIERATLTYWAWYEMEPFWDYGYISISIDGGATWTPLETPATTTENPNNRAFAAGVTGFSVGGTGWRPAPFLGIEYDARTITVRNTVPGGPAEQAGIMPDDRFVALDGRPLAPAYFVQRLNDYDAGDTLLATVLRGGQQLEIPITLGENPTRRLRPRAAWLEEHIDLTPYAGHEVLVRFEYVTDQAFTRNGWALDDIAVPEIGYLDDAESDSGGWLAEGWSRIENTLPQMYLVEVVEGTGPSVRRLLIPGEGSSGLWGVEVGPDTPATLIISAMTPYTTQTATYDLTVEPG